MNEVIEDIRKVIEISKKIFSKSIIVFKKIGKWLIKIIKSFVFGPPLTPEVTEADTDGAKIDESGVQYSFDGLKVVSVRSESTGPKGDYFIKEGTVIICDNAFENCFDLLNVTIPNSVIWIGRNAFLHQCSKLQSIIIPNSVLKIEEKAFYSSNLSKIIIPDSVVWLGSDVFDPWIKEVVSLNLTPPDLQGDVTKNIDVVIKVPEEAIDKYKSAKGWGMYKNIISVH